jgi:four helix bundle protein
VSSKRGEDSAKGRLAQRGFFGFEDLEVYQLALSLAKGVYALSAAFPKEEAFGLTGQVRRASVSVVLNIAEGKGRASDKDFGRYLVQARGSLLETVAALHLAEELGFLSREKTQGLLDLASSLNAKLTALIRSLR